MAAAISGQVFVLAKNLSSVPTPTLVTWPGGAGMFTTEATFGGGTIKLQVQTQNGTFEDVGPDTTMTVAGAAGFILPAGSIIRCLITTATAVFAYAIVL
jgi:hypothetical protein